MMMKMMKGTQALALADQLIPREAFVRKLSFHRIHQSPFWPNQQIEIRGKFQKVGTNIRPISPEKCASPEK